MPTLIYSVTASDIALQVCYYRDKQTTNKFQIAKVTKEGVTISDPFAIQTNWNFRVNAPFYVGSFPEVGGYHWSDALWELLFDIVVVRCSGFCGPGCNSSGDMVSTPSRRARGLLLSAHVWLSHALLAPLETSCAGITRFWENVTGQWQCISIAVMPQS